MTKEQYRKIESYMLSCIPDTAHDKEHIYRVLYVALEIAQNERDVDYDVLIASCLLHDVGRKEEFEDATLCHAQVGAEKAYDFLMGEGYSREFSEKVSACIYSHRYRSDSEPESIEAKILFDADKIDVTGAIGIARTLIYGAQFGEPMYALDERGRVLDGLSDEEPSFFYEYNFKLKNLYSKFYTERGKALAKERKRVAKIFYECLLGEVRDSYEKGQSLLKNIVEE